MTYKMDSDGMPRHVHECEDCKPSTLQEFKKHMKSAAIMLRAIADEAHEPLKDNCLWQAERLEKAIADSESK